MHSKTDVVAFHCRHPKGVVVRLCDWMVSYQRNCRYPKHDHLDDCDDPNEGFDHNYWTYAMVSFYKFLRSPINENVVCYFDVC